MKVGKNTTIDVQRMSVNPNNLTEEFCAIIVTRLTAVVARGGDAGHCRQGALGGPTHSRSL